MSRFRFGRDSVRCALPWREHRQGAPELTLCATGSTAWEHRRVAENSDWVEFDALVEALAWGRSVYTIVRLDQALVHAATVARTRRVEGTIDETWVNVGVNRTDVIPDAFMYVGKALQRRLSVRQGDMVFCRLRPADPEDVPVAEDIRRALAQAGRLDTFQRRSPAERRRLLQPIEEAAKPETRQRRIASLLRLLPRD